jgi:hypothetical protein
MPTRLHAWGYGFFTDQAFRPVDRDRGLNLRHGQHGPLRAFAEAPSEDQWGRLKRQPPDDTLAGAPRERFQENEKARIVNECGYLNLHLNDEKAAEIEYQPGKCTSPYRLWPCARTSAR